MQTYSNRLQTMKQRTGIQGEKKKSFLLSKLKEQQADKNKEFNLANSLVSAGTAYISSGGNPLAAAAAGLTAKGGDTDIIESGVSGLAKAKGIETLQTSGFEDPTIALQAAKTFVPGKEEEALQTLQSKKEQKESLQAAKEELQTKKQMAADEKKYRDEKLAIDKYEAETNRMLAKLKKDAKDKNDTLLKNQYSNLNSAISDTEIYLDTEISKILSNEEGLKKSFFGSNKKEIDSNNRLKASDRLMEFENKIELLAQGLKDDGLSKDQIKIFVDKIKAKLLKIRLDNQL